jgi:hypothetical protein
MDERAHSGSVSVPSHHLGRLIEVAPKGAISDLGDMQQGVEGYLVEAIRLSEFLEEFHDDEQLIELSEGAYEVAAAALTNAGYPVRSADWPTF